MDILLIISIIIMIIFFCFYKLERENLKQKRKLYRDEMILNFINDTFESLKKNNLFTPEQVELNLKHIKEIFKV